MQERGISVGQNHPYFEFPLESPNCGRIKMRWLIPGNVVIGTAIGERSFFYDIRNPLGLEIIEKTSSFAPLREASRALIESSDAS